MVFIVGVLCIFMVMMVLVILLIVFSFIFLNFFGRRVWFIMVIFFGLYLMFFGSFVSFFGLYFIFMRIILKGLREEFKVFLVSEMVLRIFVIGLVGVGKIMFVERVVREVDCWGYIVGGVIIREVCRGGRCIGFKIIVFDMGEEGIFVSLRGIFYFLGVFFGKYVVYVDEIERVVVLVIRRVIVEVDLIVIDEIGFMEYISNEFIRVVGEVLKLEKLFLVVVYRKFIDRFRFFGEVYILSFENRNVEFGIILDRVMKELKGIRG